MRDHGVTEFPDRRLLNPDDGIDEIRDMLASARVSIEEWHSFLDDFVAEPDIIARVKDQPLR